MESVTTRTNNLADRSDGRELRALLAAIHQDNVAILAALEALAEKLDADDGVTDTDYAAGIGVTLNTKE